MCKLTKNLPIQRGCWIFGIQGVGFDKGEGKFRGGLSYIMYKFLTSDHIIKLLVHVIQCSKII